MQHLRFAPRLSSLRSYTYQLFAVQRDNCQARIAILREKHRDVLEHKVKKLVKYKKTATKVKGKAPTVTLEVKPGRPVAEITGGIAKGLGEMEPPEGEGDEADVQPADFFTDTPKNKIAKLKEDQAKESPAVS